MLVPTWWEFSNDVTFITMNDCSEYSIHMPLIVFSLVLLVKVIQILLLYIITHYISLLLIFIVHEWYDLNF